MVDRVQVVRDFIAAWADVDAERLFGLFSEDAVFDNVPMAPIIGKPAIRAALMQVIETIDAAPWMLKAIALSEDGVVLTERDDIFHFSNGATATCPVMGRFTVSDEGLITHWRDYFDLSDWNRQIGLNPDFGRKAAPNKAPAIR